MHDAQSGMLALGAMVAVALLRQIRQAAKIPKVLLPWLTAAAATLGQVALLKGDVSRDQIIDAAVLGLAASGLWSGGGKYVTGKASSAVRRITGANKKVDPPTG